MSRLIDSTICPDCRATLDADATCTGCGLPVRGALAGQLWELMVAADGLVERMRAGAPRREEAPLPRHPAPPSGASVRRPRRLPAASVPVVLLSLGALCLLVAATVFIAVTWSVLGLTGRTLVLLGLTGVLAAVAVVLTRRGLRGASETFWVVVAGMLTVDLLGARNADLLGLGALSWRGTGALVGVALLALGLAVGAWARHQPVARSLAAETTAVVGALVVCVADVWGAREAAVATTVAVPVLAVLAALVRRTLIVAAYGLGGLAATSWVVLLGIGADRALEPATLAGWWAEVRGWPLLAAAVLAAAAVLVVRAPEQLRRVGSALALLPLVLLANAPVTAGTGTRDLIVACATVLVLAALAAFAPRVWAAGAAALGAVGGALLGGLLLLGPWSTLGRLDPTSANPASRTLTGQDELAAWAAVVVAVTVVAAALSVLRLLPVAHRATATRAVVTLVPATLALGALVTLLELEPPLWAAVLGAGVAAGFAGAAAWWSRGHVLAGALGSLAAAYLATVLLVASATNEHLVAASTTALFLALAAVTAVRDRESGRLSAALAAAPGALLGAWALVAWGRVLEADLQAQAVSLACYAALVGLSAAPLSRQPTTRVALEATAATLAVLATGFTGDDRTAALVLTIAGTAVCLVAVTTRDRALLGWAGAAVLGLATLVRVSERVQAPEVYTLPAALLLVVCGAWRLHHDRDSSSFTVLGSGLTLALLPSLLLALDEPVSVRGALVGAAGLLVLAAGVQQRLSAPFVLGAGTTALLALRHLQPVAEAVPRWISLGGVGLVLLVVGVTWEARRRDLDQAQRYLTALR